MSFDSSRQQLIDAAGFCSMMFILVCDNDKFLSSVPSVNKVVM